MTDHTRDTARLVGGPATGRQLRIAPDARVLRVPVPPQLTAASASDSPVGVMPDVRVVEYVRSNLPGVWVPRDRDDIPG
jgi:hypothetical protein